MGKPILSDLDFNGLARLLNLPAPVSDNEPARLADLKAAIEGLAWKDNVRVASVANVTLTAPGATINGIAMTVNDRVLLKDQTAGAENGIYIWNGAATPMTRALDANSSDELESAVVTVDEGTSANTTYRQTLVNFVLGTGLVAWATFGTTAPAASETTQGVAEIATQTEADAGTDDSRFITALKLANWVGRKLKFSQNVGDGSATSITVTHNLGTRDVHVDLYRNSGNYEDGVPDVQRASTNSVTLVFAAAPAANAWRVVVLG